MRLKLTRLGDGFLTSVGLRFHNKETQNEGKIAIGGEKFIQ